MSVAETTRTDNLTHPGHLGIVRTTPALLDRGQVWFAQHGSSLREEARNPLSWWSNNYMELEHDQLLPVSQLLRRLTDWNYHKVTLVRAPGEFASRGGIVDIFPINAACATRIEYDGNTIDTLTLLPEVSNAQPETPLKQLVSKEPSLSLEARTKQQRDHEEMLSSINPGTYVVHIDHGIGRYQGAEHIDGREYLTIEYAAGDVLRVPCDALGRVTPYIGFTQPILTRLGGNLWEKTKRNVKEDLIATARELVRIYAAREVAMRERYAIDEGLIEALEASFPYTETDDQHQAIDTIRADLAAPKPMDRVIAGDVGFGKTEIAIRAAALAVSAGYQVAIIAPTTILAHQHYKTFSERFKTAASYPVVIKKLTRIESRQEQRDVLEGLAARKVDIVIGTHRLLQQDVGIPRLGLLVIDEEQRFGVRQKEYLKERRAELDVLSLSATPLPRTLSFALSGLRDISLLETPPPGRKPIETIIARTTKKTIAKALHLELARGGQIYVLHNRIASLGKIMDLLRELVGERVRIATLHAKMPEEAIITTMDQFAAGDITILISTTIMENGLDVAHANTLIVDDATRLGLAQAHQIRGRIGRGDVQAYAYFLYPSRRLAAKPQARLSALAEHRFLGSGYQIALRDLELRGAGNFLGREQSGHIARVGFNLYCQLLNEAVEQIRTQER